MIWLNFLSLYCDSLVIYQDLGNDPDLVLGLQCILGIGNNEKNCLFVWYTTHES